MLVNIPGMDAMGYSFALSFVKPRSPGDPDLNLSQTPLLLGAGVYPNETALQRFGTFTHPEKTKNGWNMLDQILIDNNKVSRLHLLVYGSIGLTLDAGWLVVNINIYIYILSLFLYTHIKVYLYALYAHWKICSQVKHNNSTTNMFKPLLVLAFRTFTTRKHTRNPSVWLRKCLPRLLANWSCTSCNTYLDMFG